MLRLRPQSAPARPRGTFRKLPWSVRRAALAAGLGITGLIWAGSLSPGAAHGAIAAGPALDGGNVRVSTHDFFPTDPFFWPLGAPHVFPQHEPSLALHSSNP